MGECNGDSCGWKLGSAEIVGKGFALLGKDFADEGEKSSFLKAEFREARGESPAEHGGVDVRRRREG